MLAGGAITKYSVKWNMVDPRGSSRASKRVKMCLYLKGRDLKLTWVGEGDANACKKHKKREDW